MSDNEFQVGEIVQFNAYSELEEGAEAILAEGQRVMVRDARDNGSYVVHPVDQNGDLIEADNPQKGDAVFPEELLKLADAPAQETQQDKPTDLVEAATQAAEQAEETPETAPKVDLSGRTFDPAAKKASLKSMAEEAGLAIPSSWNKTQIIESLVEHGAQEAKAEPVQQPKAETEAPEPQAEVEAQPEPQPEPPVEQTEAAKDILAVTDSESVRSILDERDALDAAEFLVKQADKTYFTLGGVLQHIYTEGIHKRLGFEGKRAFSNYVEQRLGVQYRKAMYLIDIYVKFRKLGVDENRLAEIGWSKAKELARIPDDNLEQDFDKLVDKASETSRNDLSEYIKSEYEVATRQNNEQVKKTTFKFSLFADQAEVVNQAIDSAKAMLGSDDGSAAFEQICSEWAAMSDGVDIPIEQAIHALEQRYGVRLRQMTEEEIAVEAEAPAEEQDENETVPAE